MATDPASSGRRSSVMDLVANLVFIGLCAVLGWSFVFRTDPAPKPRVVAVPKETIDVSQSPSAGDPRAQVVLIEYSDYQCPACIQFSKAVWPKIEKHYVALGRLRFALKHLPLAGLHPEAKKAAEAAECAAAQGQFWQMHTKLFEDPKALSLERLHAKATEARLDKKLFASCMNGTMSGKVQQDLDEAARLGIKVTPTFLLGRPAEEGRVKVSQVLSGLRAKEMLGAIDSLLADERYK